MPTSLQKYLSRLNPAEFNTFLLHLSRLLSTSTGIEATLSTTYFTLTLLHSQLTHLLAHQYTRLAHTLTLKTASPDTLLTTPLHAPQTRLSQTCAGVKHLALLSRETWTFLRLWGLLHLYRWGYETHTKPPRDAIIKLLTWMQIASAGTFQILENFGFLAGKGVLGGEKWERRAPKLMAIGYRFWMVKCLLEVLRLGRVRQLRWDERFGAEREGQKEVKIQSAELKRKWTRQLWAIAGWLGVMLHWSFVDEDDRPVGEVWEGVSGLVPSVIMLEDAWRASA